MKKSSTIRLIKPNLRQTELDAVQAVLASGMLVSGSKVEAFEKRLALYFDIPFAILVSSGTAALHLSLMSIGIGPGDEVLVSSFTFPATANAIELVGAKPVFVDCMNNSMNLDPDLVAGSIGPKTKAILPVHAFGLPADMDRLMAIAQRYGLTVIEDAACALGSKYRGRWCGTFGLAGIFSFHPRKLLTTGEGGAVITADAEMAECLRGLRNHGFVNGSYQFVGLNYRMTDFQAAMGATQLNVYQDMLARRYSLAQYYWEKLQTFNWLRPIMPDDGVEWNVQTLLVCLDECIDRQSLMAYLLEHDIESTIGTYCLPLTPYYQTKYGYTTAEFPFGDRLHRQLLSLPLYTDLSKENIDRIVSALDSFASQT
jgi:dTDP-4-amino-4,6-dideoxygalactose transaminase